MLNKGDQVKVTKIVGSDNDEIHEGYWLLGTVINDVTMDECFMVLRQVRNGVKWPGLFQTSPVNIIVTKNAVEAYAITRNSTFKVEPWEGICDDLRD